MIVDCFYNCLIKNSNYDDVVAKIENNSVQILLTIKVTNILNFIKPIWGRCSQNTAE